MCSSSASRRASILSFWLPSLMEGHSFYADRTPLTNFVTCGFQQVIQPGGRGSFFKGDLPQISAQPHPDKLQNHARFRRRSRIAITIFPAPFLTAIEMLSLCTSMPIYFLLSIEGVPFCRG